MKRGDFEGFLYLGGMLAAFLGIVFLVPRGTHVQQDIIPLDMPTAALAVEAVVDAGLSISYTVERDGFVSVHRAMGDAPGEILGQMRVEKGTGEVTVPTADAVGPVTVLFFADDGDGVFALGVDRPVVRDGVSVRTEAVLRSDTL